MADVLNRYQSLVDAGEISADAAQLAVARRLNALNAELADYRLTRRKSTGLAWLFSRGEKREPVRGLYVWGDVGRGKTMLMDLFIEASPVKRKRRVHFHEFMADVHERIHAYRQKLKAGEVKGDDPIAPVAADLAEEAWLLCFDEFSVTDIADAMILGRLFGRLFEEGVVVVATSNVVPDLLYRDGLNRALFLPFIRLLQERMAVVKLESRTDFRLEKLAGQPVWITPNGAEADAAMEAAWLRLTGGAAGEAAELSD
jgi:cell division protein ZapE